MCVCVFSCVYRVVSHPLPELKGFIYTRVRTHTSVAHWLPARATNTPPRFPSVPLHVAPGNGRRGSGARECWMLDSDHLSEA